MIRRVGRWIPAGAVGLSLAAAIGGAWPFAASVLLGGFVAWVGFAAHVQMVDAAMVGGPRRWLRLKLFLRYGLLAGSLYAMLRFQFLDPAGFFVGLLLPAVAILIECVVYVISQLRGS